MFTTTLQLRVHGNRFAEDELYQVTETCHYTAWASREIVCNNNFMEVRECSKGHIPVCINGSKACFSVKAGALDLIAEKFVGTDNMVSSSLGVCEKGSATRLHST